MRLFFWKSCNEILIVSSSFLLLKKVSLAQGRNVFLHPSNIWDCEHGVNPKAPLFQPQPATVIIAYISNPLMNRPETLATSGGNSDDNVPIFNLGWF